MKCLRFLQTGLIALLVLTSGVWSQQAHTPTASDPTTHEPAQALNVPVGTGHVVELPGEVTRVAVAEDQIAKVTILSSSELLVHAVSVGRTSMFAWLENGNVERFMVRVSRDIQPLQTVLLDLDPRIGVEETPDGRNLILRGEVVDPDVVRSAEERAKQYISSFPEPRPVLMNLLHGPAAADADGRLQEALQLIDPRISLRRIQVGSDLKTEVDSYVLEGHVKTVTDVVRAVMLAERQLGGTGNQVGSASETRISEQRYRGLFGGAAATGSSDNNQLQALERQSPLPAGIASQIARGMVIASESGRVLSFLKVDSIHQVMVSIRVLEVDRVKARQAGIDYRIDGDHLSIQHFNRPDMLNLGSVQGAPAIANKIGQANLVGAYASRTVAILTALDFLQERNVARSVAEPNVMTLTGEEATVVVGGEVPIPTTTATQVTAVQGFFFQSFGVRLDIRPTVDGEDVITLEVAPSIVRPEQDLAVEGVPGFEVQTVQTVARVRSDESLILGGLLNYAEGVKEGKGPLLGAIPLPGLLVFRWTEDSRTEQELLFVITPRIMLRAEDGIQRPVTLPSMESHDHRLRQKIEPAFVTEDGLPSSWVILDEQEAAE